MTNEELVEQIQAGINVRGNLEVLYEQNKGLIYKTVNPFKKCAEFDDLLQEAYIGLHEAVYAYKPGESKFATYFPWRIRKCCIRYLENTSNTKRIPVSRLNEIRKYQKFCQEYANAHGITPDDKTIMKELELTEKRLDNIRKTIYEQNCISIHSAAPGTEDAALEDILADETDIAADVENQVFKEEVKEIVDDAVDQLQPNQSYVIRERYLENATLCQVATEMRISIERVRQIERKALQRLKGMHQLQELHDEIYGYDSHFAYSMTVKCAVDNHTSSTEMLAMKRLEYEERYKKTHDELDDLFNELLEG